MLVLQWFLSSGIIKVLKTARLLRLLYFEFYNNLSKRLYTSVFWERLLSYCKKKPLKSWNLEILISSWFPRSNNRPKKPAVGAITWRVCPKEPTWLIWTNNRPKNKQIQKYSEGGRIIRFLGLVIAPLKSIWNQVEIKMKSILLLKLQGCCVFSSLEIKMAGYCTILLTRKHNNQ